MRRTARPLTGMTGTALAVAAAGLLAAPAHAGAGAVPAARPHGTSAGALEAYPSSVAPGAQVTVGTAACGGDGSAAGDASAVGGGRFTLAPDAHGGEATGRFQVPPGAQPGTYEIVATCAGSGRRVSGDLEVTLTPGAQQVRPRGSVKTGVGGALGPDPVQTAAGVTALAVAAAGGTWLLHRRARGDGI
ncbi:hypothetical protein [Streptomyces capillispiralis]|uniref:MYXO-CTERM domain-containing protein n=1 Tax=Streptomyces capillispiralis TaxID=68182 RepID=A0A561TKG9_9ACTN|nr:hypothetical protein [Streptomyces capillispiralis]TWF87618.1 hypothetical protein FHX78_114631 [Streptomyces capillispiralis]GHH93755.1 hypothetical protein GCM10017779_42120 [Streptomyces capillispiralis]